MRIYDRTAGPNPARIRIVIAEKGLEPEIDYVSIDLISAEQKTPEFLAKNPTGKIPVLELDDGTCIAECTAITEYLDNLDDHPLLTGRTPLEKGMIHMMQRHAEIMVLETVDDYFHYGTAGLGPALRPWRMPEWTGAKEWGLRRGDQMVSQLSYFDKILAKRPFLAGSEFSMADISLYAGLAFARIVGLPVAADLSAISDWEGRVSSRPSVRNRSGQEVHPDDLDRMTDAVNI